MSIAQAVANMASFVIVWAVARGMGDAAYGVFAAAYALATSVGSLADSGVRMALIREIACAPKGWRKLWFYAVSISLLLACIVSLVFIVVVSFEESLASQELRLWLLGYALLWTLVRITLGIPAGHQRLISVAAWGAVERMSGAVLVAWLVFYNGSSLLELAQGLFALEFVVLILLIVWVKLQAWPTDATLNTSAQSFIKVALPFGVSAAAFAVLGRLDLIVLGFQQAPDVVGHYAAAQLLAMIGIFIGVAVSSSLFPALSQLAKTKDLEQAKRLINPALGLLTLVMIVLAMLLSSLAEWLLIYVYGDDYALGSAWLILFALAAPFMAINAMAGAIIGAWGWQARWAKLLWKTLPVVMVMYWLSGGWMDVWGVAIVSVGTQLFLTTIAWQWMVKEGIVDAIWMLRLLALMTTLALFFYLVPKEAHWLSIPVSLLSLFSLKICQLSWIKTALKVVR